MAVLDDAEDCVRLVAAPWVGVLVLCVLPFRFVQAYLIDLVFEWGHQANQYGDYLWGVSWVGGVFFLFLLYGRIHWGAEYAFGGSMISSPSSSRLP